MKKSCIPISVIIPTLNRHETLIQTVKSLCSGECVPKEIIVIDQTASAITKDQFESIDETSLVIEHSPIASSTHARNVGIEKAREEILLFCDDDVLINNDTLRDLYSLISDNEVALVSAIHYRSNAIYVGTKKCNLLNEIGGTLIGMKKFWRKDGYVIKSNMRGRYADGINTITDTEWAMGYFFCVKKQVIKKMNHFFDEHLIRYAYAEDLDFTYRYCIEARESGLKTIVAPKLYINHLASREWRIPKQEEVNYIFANRRYLSWKLFPSKAGYRVAMWMFDILYLLTQLPRKKYAIEIKNALILCWKNRDAIKEGSIANLTDLKEVNK